MERAFAYVSKVIYLLILLFVTYSNVFMDRFDSFFVLESFVWIIILVVLFIAEIWSAIKSKKSFITLFTDILVLLSLIVTSVWIIK